MGDFFAKSLSIMMVVIHSRFMVKDVTSVLKKLTMPTMLSQPVVIVVWLLGETDHR